MMEDLKRLTNRRTGLKSSLTKSVGVLRSQLGTEPLDIISIEERISIIEETLSRYRQVQDGCLELTVEEDIDITIENETDFEESVIDTLISAKARVSKSRNFTSKDTSTHETNDTSVLGHDNLYKLPRVEIPNFSGVLTEWLAFIQSFEQAVSVTNVPNTVKFTILRNHLNGEALETIKFFSITNENYPVALKTLKDRYGDTDRLIEIYVEQLIALKEKTEQLSLRQIYNQLLTIVSTLENLKISRDQYAVLLVPMLKNVFSHHLQIKWAVYEKSIKANPSLQNTNRLTLFLDFLKDEVEILETAKSGSDVTKNANKPAQSRHFHSVEPRPTATFHTGQRFESSFSSPRPPRFHQHEQFFAPRWRPTTYTGTAQRLRPPFGPGFQTLAKDQKHAPPCCFCRAKCGQTNHHHPSTCKFAVEFDPGRVKELIIADNRCERCLGPRNTVHCLCSVSCFLCSGAHHTLSCEQRLLSAPRQQNGSHVKVKSVVDATFPERKSTPQTILPTATVEINGPSGPVHARVLLDTGSQRTYVTRKLSSDIHARQLRFDFLASEGFGGRKEKPRDVEVVSIALQSLDGQSEIEIEALVVETIASSNFNNVRRDNIENLVHLKDIALAGQIGLDPIDILIGQDHYWDIVDGEVRRGEKGEPVAMKTIFGYVLSGPVPMNADLPRTEVGSFFCKGEGVCENLEKFWTFESMGIDKKEKSNNEEAIESFMRSIQYDDKQYEVGLPWKPDHPPLVKNIEKAKTRLLRLQNKLEDQPQLSKMYQEAMQELIDETFVEEVLEIADEDNLLKGREFYLPHRPVLKQGESSYKCRPVFDASAKDMNGLSLNDCLLTGPCLLPNILEILLQFRWWNYGLIGDIKRAFLQINISPKDRDALRFLWNDKIFRFRKVPFGLCCSPYLLNQTIQHHLNSFPVSSEQEKTLIYDISKAFYVDDLITGADNLCDLHLKLSTAYTVLLEAGMTLRNWSCSMERLQNQYSKTYEFDDKSETGVLGLNWNKVEDTLKPKMPIWNVECTYTKRNILSYLAQIYDPLGLLSPLTVQGKLLMQSIWKESYDWDDTVSLTIQNLTKDFIHNCNAFSTLAFPRSVRPLDDDGKADENKELLIFCDAGNQACGAVAYYQQQNHSQLVASKVKVAPLNSKTMSIPRLELISCLIGSRLAKTIREIEQYKELPVTFYTDSTVALSWIRSGVEHKTQRELFINNRVKEILMTTTTTEWNHIATHQNPADLLTRSNSIDRLHTEEGIYLWMCGPRLPSPRELSLKETVNNVTDCDKHSTAVKEINLDGAVLFNTQDVPKDNDEKTLAELFDLPRFSDMKRVLKVTAYVLRFKDRITKTESQHSKTIKAGKKSNQEVPVPSIEEIKKAELIWIKSIQQVHFSEEIQSLRSGHPIKKSSSLRDLKPVWTDDGLLRSMSRANLPPPILLPQNDAFVTMIVRDIHANNFHSGINFTLCEIRQRFWIIKGRQTVKRILNKCLTCKRHSAQPYQQVLAPLPAWRATQQPAFETVGMDFCGPLNVVEGKAYVMIFSCAVTRACHLELTSDMSTNSTFQGLRRMTSRRGICKLIVCDNARSFKKLRQSLTTNIRFYFIPPYSPWFGGFYERLNSSIKTALKKSLGKTCLSFQELSTILTEIESFINHRPITHVTDDAKDPLPLRPVDFIRTPGPPVGGETSKRDQLMLRFKHRKTVLSSVWNQWRRQYLHQLHQWSENRVRCSGREPKIGDVVIIDPFTTKNKALFPLGKITDVIIGKDGVIRSVYVKTKGGTFVRSTRHVFPLETDGEEPDATTANDEDAGQQTSRPVESSNDVHSDAPGVIRNSVPVPCDDRPPTTRLQRVRREPKRLDL